MVDPREAARTLIRRHQAEERRAEERASGLRERLPEAARLLREMGAREVWLFGTLAWGGFHAHSDADLAVAGLPPEAWARAAAAVEDVLGAMVDLVRFEEIDDAFGHRIRTEGERIDGAH
ncbi:MAG: nucleotidyltransferase domain-containing protein [Myxococcota bacterium]